MSAPGDETRLRLLDAAMREFAEHGVRNASLLEITRMAGQRNRGAVHYHFGSREGMLVAVLESEAGFLAEREGQLLEVARQRPDDDVAAVLEAIVRPVVELAETGWRGRCYLRIIGEIIELDTATFEDEVAVALAKTGGGAVYALLHERIPPLDDELRNERSYLVTTFILQAVADRARAVERATPSRPIMETERFITNLVSMTTGMLMAPVV